MLVQVADFFVKTEDISFAQQQVDGIAFSTSKGLSGFVSKSDEDYGSFLQALVTATKCGGTYK